MLLAQFSAHKTPVRQQDLFQLRFPIHVVWWTKWFSTVRFNEYMTGKGGCPFPEDININPLPASDVEWCRLSHDRSAASMSPVLAFHLRDLNYNDLPARDPSQPWVLMSQESPINDHTFGQSWTDPMFLARFNLSMSYRLDSDIPFPYAEAPAIVSSLAKPMDDYHLRRSGAAGQATVLWLGSNCNAVNQREVYLKELLKHLPVDSLGKCLATGTSNRSMSTLEIIQQYKFFLALENSNCEGYVTEKLFNALKAGAVPIVSGPPGSNASGYEMFIPNRNSVIPLDAFPNPRDLAQYILRIEGNKTLWDSFRAHRFSAEGFSKHFLDLWNRTHVDWGLCGLCRTAARTYWNQLNGEALSPRSIVIDRSCQPPGSIANLLRNP